MTAPVAFSYGLLAGVWLVALLQWGFRRRFGP